MNRNSSSFRIVLLAGMALLWVLVASLQYKSMSQLSSVNELRLGSNLQSLMAFWQRDFYDEISAICVALQVGPDSGAHDGWNDYLQRYAEWRGITANHPAGESGSNEDLVKEAYEWRTSLPGQPQLLRLNATAMTLDPVTPPSNMGQLLSRLQASSGNLSMAMRAWDFGARSSEQSMRSEKERDIPSRSNALAGWQLDETIPALVHPVVHHIDPFSSLTPVDRVAVDWIVVVLDAKVIQDRILPELVNRHFGGPDGLEYKLAVVAFGNEPEIIYSSEAGLTVREAEMFDLALDLSGASSVSAPLAVRQLVKSSPQVRDQDWKTTSAPTWFPVIQYDMNYQSWVLFLQHKTGPVSAIARRAWNRDLMIGGVVLCLLAVNMGLVVYSSLRAQKLAKVQMEFVASVSHELRTPLAAIFSASENIKDGFVKSGKDLEFYGSILTSQARRLTDLVDRILMFASTGTGKVKYSLKALSVATIVAAVRKNMIDEIAAGGSTLEEQIEADLPPVWGDLSAVCACLQNLIANAIKYGGADRWIGLAVVSHDKGKKGREVQFKVSDHGEGIAANELHRIFEPFYRNPKVVADQVPGTGLGLPLARRIAEALGGRISTVSEPGVGSTFTLHLRAAEPGELLEMPQVEMVRGKEL